LVIGISAKGEFLSWLGCWINDKQIIFSYVNLLIGDKRRKRGIKSGSTLGLLLYLVVVMCDYETLRLIKNGSCNL
jgi:hypothetical protein